MPYNSSKALIDRFDSFLAVPDKSWVLHKSTRPIRSLTRVALEWISRVYTWFASHLWFLISFTAVLLQDHPCVLQITIRYADHHDTPACIVAEAHAFRELASYHPEEDSSWSFLFGTFLTHQVDLMSVLCKLSFKLRLALALRID